jgi:hypothetical protein
MQRIVGLLVFQTTEPMPIMEISAWIARRFGQPIEAVVAQIEDQDHRRFLKSHLPLDGLPFYDNVKYIHVAGDGQDACMSFHNHLRIASFLDISVAPELWPELIAAASFEAMRRDGDALMSKAAASFKDGGRSFFFKGANERWRGVASEEDLALYEAKAEAMLLPACARWVASGRFRAGDPRQL